MEKWLLRENVDFFKSLKELILMEHFTNLANKNIGAKIREKRFRTVKEAATWADDRVLALRAPGVKPVSTCAIPFTRDKYASGIAWGNRSICQWKKMKEIRVIRQKALLLVLSSPVFFCMQEGHIKPNCAKWKATYTPKPVALVLGTGKNSEGGLECGMGGNGVVG